MQKTSKAYQIYQKELAKCRIFDQKIIKKYIKGYKKFDDKSCLDKIVESNSKYIRALAAKKLSPKFDILDLINEGNLGLISAIENYDSKFKNTFLSFAHSKIEGKIMLYIDTYTSKVHTPYNIVIESNKVKRYIENYEQIHNYTPRPETIAEDTDIKLDIIKKELNYINNIKSNKYINEDYNISKEDIQNILNEHLSILNEDQRDIINKYFGTFGEFKTSSKDIAKERNTSIRKIEKEIKKIINFLKQAIKNNNI